MFRKSLTALVTAGLLATLSLLASAYFTAQATVTSNTFTTGTLDLTAMPATTALTFTNMAPGDRVTAPITVTNAGSLPLRYAMTSSTVNGEFDLSGQILVYIKTAVTQCTNEGFAQSGTMLNWISLNLISLGDPSPEQQDGDRLLAPGAQEVLCFSAYLPSETDNLFLNLATTATFTFQAEQVANNP
ncbi:spore coat-associated protein N [Anaerolineae bacterium]|nr:spore coat-associated protein N [Anaerolineae bacterium]